MNTLILLIALIALLVIGIFLMLRDAPNMEDDEL
jgi:hypothetical protein